LLKLQDADRRGSSESYGTRIIVDLLNLTRTTAHLLNNNLGPGFPEFVARRALAIMIGETGLAVREEIELPVWFRGQRIAKFRADLLVADTLLVEVKVSPEIDAFHTAQVLHYLKASDLEVGLLLNFGREPQFKRVVYQRSRNRRYFETPSQEEVARSPTAWESSPQGGQQDSQ
jgi:GxxExxY protein